MIKKIVNSSFIRKTKDNINPSFIFFLTIGVTIIATIIFLMVTRGQYLETFLFSDKGDNFMDFFHPINHSFLRDPYISTDRIYPAICYLFYYLLSLFIPYETCAAGGGAIRNSMEGQFVFIVYILLTTTALVLLLYRLIAVERKEKRIAIVIVLLFTSCFIFQFMRANIILVTLIGTLFFVNYYNSKNKIIRELAIIALAFSTCIKIYPVAFAFFLVKEKKWYATIRFIIYTILIFILPFGVIGGFNQIPIMINNLLTGIQYTENIGFGYKINVTNTLSVLSWGFHNYIPEEKFKIVSYILLAFAVLSIFFIKERWKQYAIVGLVIAGIPGFSFVYSLIFMVIPLIFFINDVGKEKKWYNYCYLIMFITIFALFPYLDNLELAKQIGGMYTFNLQTFIEGIGVLIFLITLSIEGLVKFIIFIKELIENKKKNEKIDYKN